MAASPSLTPGACRLLHGASSREYHPVLMVRDWRVIGEGAASKVKCRLSDGDGEESQAVFLSDVRAKLFPEEAPKTMAVKLTDYQFSELKDNTKVLVVKDAETLDGAPCPPSAKRLKGEGGEPATPAPVKAEAAAPATAAPQQKKKVLSIEALSPYGSAAGCLKLRVTSKRPVRAVQTRVGEKNVLNVELAEVPTGISIEATAWGDNAAKFDSLLVENKAFYLSRFRVSLASKKYKTTDSEYTLGLESDTVAEPLTEAEEADIAAAQGDPRAAVVKAMASTGISDLAVRMNRNPRALMDVFGVVTEVGAPRSVKRKSDGTELQTREVTVVDDSGKSVNCAMWGEFVDSECAEMEAALAGSPEKAVVVALRHVRATSWNGVSLSTLSKSKVVINPDELVPDCARAAALRRWYETEGGKATSFVSAGEGLATAGGSPGDGLTPEQRANERKLFAALEVADPNDRSLAEKEYATVRATVVFVKTEQNLYYLAAPDGSNKKVTDNGDGTYWCEGLQKTFESATRRYIFSAKAVDSTGGECWLNLFNEQGEALFGRTADDMHALAPEAKERAIKAAQWKTGVFRLVRQLREWEGQRKVRVNASSMAQVDFAAESRILLQALKAL